MRSTMRADGARGRPAWQICLGLVLVPILTLAGGGGGSPLAVGGFVACAALGLCLVAATRMPLYQILVIVGGGQLVCWRMGGRLGLDGEYGAVDSWDRSGHNELASAPEPAFGTRAMMAAFGAGDGFEVDSPDKSTRLTAARLAEEAHQDAKDIVTTVSCGGHYAPSCELCGGGPAWCNGVCGWNAADERCMNLDDLPTKPLEEPTPPLSKGDPGQQAENEEAEEKAAKEADSIDKTDRKAAEDGKKATEGGEKKKTDTRPNANDPSGLTLSVVLPCAFEHGLMIQTIKSVYEATPPDVLHEIVVVDDGSAPALKGTFPTATRDYKVKWLRHEHTRGLIQAKSTGGDAATGDVIVFFDCHVKPDENYWKSMVRLIERSYRL